MNSSALAAPEFRRQLSLLVAVWVPACLLIYLVAVQPYASGYEFVRTSLLATAATQWNRPDWEHCGLVPLACAVILYFDKDRLAQIVPRSSVWGLVVSAFGFFVYWAGYRVDNHYIGYASIQILLTGMILSVLGWRFTIALIFPLLFLTFMWPVLFLDNMLAFPLRLVMSEQSVNVLNFIGIHAMQVGTAIQSAPESLAGVEFRPPGALFKVDVADPCSGIRSLFALMMVSALYGYFTFSSPWKRLVLFICSVPLAVLGNLFRILMLTIGTLAFGSEFAIGKSMEETSWFHSAAGFVVFGVALVGMLVIHKLLELNPSKIRERFKQAPKPVEPVSVPVPAKLIEREDEY